MGWDRGYSYEYLVELLLRYYRRCRTVKCKCITSVYLIQLRNGSRVSEALRAYECFLAKRATECAVPISKSTGRTRLMVFPSEYLSFSEFCELCTGYTPSLSTLKSYIKNAVKRDLNTHTLRYAYITHLLRYGVNPSIVAKITGHTALNTILVYTQTKHAEEVLRALG
ncbi:MAG: tyrosine-type recombinase/integrase [Desulfurococcaceae archaeon]